MKYVVIGGASDIVDVPQGCPMPLDGARELMEARAESVRAEMCANWSVSRAEGSVTFTDKDGYWVSFRVVDEPEYRRLCEEQGRTDW